MKHLLDTNTLIEAKNRYYGMTICPAYWSWLLLQNQAFELASIVTVKDELTRGKDDLAEWAKDNASLFQDISDGQTQAAFGQIAAAIAEQSAKMKVGALEEFLSGADPWLIAKAMTTGATVVTHEVLNREVKRKFIIPNVCEMFGVPYMNTFELLNKLEARFVLPV
ncbi:DUF4411 family protein [Pseudomonas corrugata]|uniref:DUF4411 family protein n=1 Tax=Pseudomonas corrugata TaxID=47879 RepID=UPI000463A288|nr:DUF4411 family protein [Pseudomonas corrugata]MDU9026198.1 DUF4411 family protein [Pseudomonas corrugata]MDU9042830.1 DUF4411 family protein [Pseudomonas corrugata]